VLERECIGAVLDWSLLSGPVPFVLRLGALAEVSARLRSARHAAR
jgi:hypothetical protein